MEKIAISFSGGRSSALMTKLVLDKYKRSEIEITFANTGFEHPDTLRFVNDCDRFLFNNRVVWIESVVSPVKGEGVGFKVVDYETAARNGEPYIAGVRKYGLWNQTSPACKSRLKIEPMEKYLKTKGFIRGKNLNYWTAIGIRVDEIDRVSVNYKENQIFYPLIDEGVNKREVLKKCAALPFDLKIDEHYGNCVGCFKKSTRKLATIAKDTPEYFDKWKEIENELKDFKTENNSDPQTGFRRIYRKQNTVSDLIQIGNQSNFRPFSSKEKDGQGYLFDDFDLEFGCGESCEIY
jgi:hypothetical protein